MNVTEGAVVSVEGSDSLWVVQSVNKSKCNLIDAQMGIIELEDIDLTEITGVISEAEVP